MDGQIARRAVKELENIPAGFKAKSWFRSWRVWGAVATPPGPLVAGPDGDRLFAEGARRLRESTDRAVIGLFGGNLLEIGQFLYRIDNFLMLLAGNPRRAHEFLDRLVELHLQNLEKYLSAVGEYIDIILFGDDLGSNGKFIDNVTAAYLAMFSQDS